MAYMSPIALLQHELYPPGSHPMTATSKVMRARAKRMNGLGYFTPSGDVHPLVRMVPVHALRAGPLSGMRGFGFLGASWAGASGPLSTAGGAAGAAGATALAGGSAALAGATFGSVVPVVGTLIGAAVGALAGGLFGHADHAQIARDVQARKDIFGQYANVVGTVPGRTIGLAQMRQIWKGAAHLGHFPKWAGQEQRIDYAIDGCRRCDKNTMNVLWPSAKAAGVRDALTFYKNYFLPANTQLGDHWAVDTDALGTQIVIDAIDAYLGEQDPTTTPYISNPQAAAAAPAVTPAQAVAAPTPAPVPAPLPGALPGVQLPAINFPPGFTPDGPLAGGLWIGHNAAYQEFVFDPRTGQLTPAPPDAPLAGAPVQPPLVTAVPGTPATTALDPATAQLIQQLLSSGASQQQAFQAAMQQLQAQGVQPTPQLQQAVAQDVGQAAAAAPTAPPVTAGVGTGKGMLTWLAVGAGVAVLMFAGARPAKSKGSKHA